MILSTLPYSFLCLRSCNFTHLCSITSNEIWGLFRFAQSCERFRICFWLYWTLCFYVPRSHCHFQPQVLWHMSINVDKYLRTFATNRSTTVKQYPRLRASFTFFTVYSMFLSIIQCSNYQNQIEKWSNTIWKSISHNNDVK